MKTEKSEELNPVVYVDDHFPPLPDVFSHIFCFDLKHTHTCARTRTHTNTFCSM